MPKCNPVVATAILVSLQRLNPAVSEQMRMIKLCAQAWGVWVVPTEAFAAPDTEEVVQLANNVFPRSGAEGVHFTTTGRGGTRRC